MAMPWRCRNGPRDWSVRAAAAEISILSSPGPGADQIRPERFLPLYASGSSDPAISAIKKARQETQAAIREAPSSDACDDTQCAGGLTLAQPNHLCQLGQQPLRNSQKNRHSR